MKEEPKTIHEILQDAESYSSKLAVACRTNASNVIQVVKLEKNTSKYWPEIEKLAIATDPEAYHMRMAWLEEQKTNDQPQPAA